jgi:hypothetical protein
MVFHRLSIIKPRSTGIVRGSRLVSRRPTGIIKMYKDGVKLWETRNLIVNEGLGCMAETLAGNTAFKVAAVGFGSGSTPAAVTDTDLSGAQKYYNAVGSATFPTSGTVSFAFSLTTTDFAANGLVLQELGLFANNASGTLPSESGFTIATRANSTAYVVGNLVVDAAGTHVFRCTTAGTSASSAPTFNTAAIGNTTTDGTVTWTYIAAVSDFGASNEMVAHAVVPSFTYNGSGAYSGTWSITF